MISGYKLKGHELPKLHTYFLILLIKWGSNIEFPFLFFLFLCPTNYCLSQNIGDLFHYP